jgi:predicted DNA-binding transcriptional regulator AlpA
VSEDHRPPAYLSRSTLARELDVAESTVDEMVKRGVLPPPIRLSAGCVRWEWKEVETALGSLKGKANPAEADPYLTGVKNVTEITRERQPS